MNARRRLWLLGTLALPLALAACQRDAADEPAADEAAPAAQPATGDSMGMGGMAGMSGMQMGTDVMGHMQRMEGMHGDSLMQMVPTHRQMLGNMMGQMEREMQGMNMSASPEWTALADSLRDDAVRMPQMTAAEMEAFMAGHRGRVMRMMEMHGTMMPGMENPR